MCYNFVDDDGASDTGLSTEAAVVIFVVTLLVSVTVTAIISSIVTCVCVKRRAHNPNDKSLQQRVIYEEVSSPTHATIAIKNNLELQLNCDKVVMDTDPAYASCK